MLKKYLLILIFITLNFSCKEKFLQNFPLEELRINFTDTQNYIEDNSRKGISFNPLLFKNKNRVVIYYPVRSEVYIMNSEGKLIDKKIYGKLLNANTIIDFSKTATTFSDNLYLLFHDKITKLNIHSLEEKTISFKFPKSPSNSSHFHFISEDEFLISLDDRLKNKSELSFYKGNIKTGTLDLILKLRVDGLKPPYGVSLITQDQLAFLRMDESKIEFYDFSGNLKKETNFKTPRNYTFRKTPVFYSNEINSAPDLPFSDKYTGIDIYDDRLYLSYRLFTEDVKNKYQNTAMMMVYDFKSKIKKEFEQPNRYYMMASNGQFFNMIKENDQAILEYKILKNQFKID